MESQSQQCQGLLYHAYTHKLAGIWGCRAAVCLHIHVAAYVCTQNVVEDGLFGEGAHTGWTNFGVATDPRCPPPPLPTPLMTKEFVSALRICKTMIMEKSIICKKEGRNIKFLNIVPGIYYLPIQRAGRAYNSYKICILGTNINTSNIEEFYICIICPTLS